MYRFYFLRLQFKIMSVINSYPKVKLGDICNIEVNRTPKQNGEGTHPFINGSFKINLINTFTHNIECIMLVRSGNLGQVYYWNNGPFTPSSNLFIIKKHDNALVNYKYLYLFLKANQSYISDLAVNPSSVIHKGNLENLEIHLPKLELQQQIVEAYNLLETKKATIEAEIDQFVGSFQYADN